MIHTYNATEHSPDSIRLLHPKAAIIRQHHMKEPRSVRWPTIFVFDEGAEAVGHWTGR